MDTFTQANLSLRTPAHDNESGVIWVSKMGLCVAAKWSSQFVRDVIWKHDISIVSNLGTVPSQAWLPSRAEDTADIIFHTQLVMSCGT